MLHSKHSKKSDVVFWVLMAIIFIALVLMSQVVSG